MGLDPLDYLQFFLALGFVLGLIGLGSLLLRRYGPGGLVSARLRPGQKRRLSVIETLPLDPRRRVVLIKRDGVEHLLLLGPQTETVVEQGVVPPEGPSEDERTDGVDPVSAIAAVLPKSVTKRFQSPASKARLERRSASNDGGTA